MSLAAQLTEAIRAIVREEIASASRPVLEIAEPAMAPRASEPLKCPHCGRAGANVIESKLYPGYMSCWKKKHGCGKRWEKTNA